MTRDITVGYMALYRMGGYIAMVIIFENCHMACHIDPYDLYDVPV